MSTKSIDRKEVTKLLGVTELLTKSKAPKPFDPVHDQGAFDCLFDSIEMIMDLVPCVYALSDIVKIEVSYKNDEVPADLKAIIKKSYLPLKKSGLFVDKNGKLL